MPRFRILLPILALLAAAAASPVPAASASTSQDAIFQDDGQLRANPLGTLQQLRCLGVTRVRVGIPWNLIAPNGTSTRRPAGFNASDPAARGYHWSTYDEIARAGRTEGINLYFVIVGPAPRWAVGPGVPHGGLPGPWRPSVKEFGSFVTALGKRYSGTYQGLPKISFFSVWNEPNYGIYLAPEATNHDSVEVAAGQYRGLVDAAWTALARTGHSHDTFLWGELAPHGYDHPIGNYNVMRPLRFIRALFCVDSGYRQYRGSAASARGCPTTAAGSRQFRAQHPGLFRASGYAAHPYAQRTPPNRSLLPNPSNADLAEDRTAHPHAGPGQWRVRLTHSPADLEHRVRLPDQPARGGGAQPDDGGLLPELGGVHQLPQPADPQLHAVRAARPTGGNFASGLEFSNGTPKQPVFNAYRMPLYLPRTSGRRGGLLEVWGDARPAFYGTGGQQVGDSVPGRLEGPLRLPQPRRAHQPPRLFRRPPVLPTQRLSPPGLDAARCRSDPQPYADDLAALSQHGRPLRDSVRRRSPGGGLPRRRTRRRPAPAPRGRR